MELLAGLREKEYRINEQPATRRGVHGGGDFGCISPGGSMHCFGIDSPSLQVGCERFHSNCALFQARAHFLTVLYCVKRRDFKNHPFFCFFVFCHLLPHTYACTCIVYGFIIK